MTLLQVSKLSEDQAREYLESIRWPDGPICPHCGTAEDSTKLAGKATRPGVYKCRSCQRQYTVTVKTVMHRSHMTLQQWVTAFHLMCSSKKGVSALQLQRDLGIGSYRTAWFMCHRIRAAMEEMNMLSADVEVDECYIGSSSKGKGKTGRGTTKTPVLAMVERDGKAHSRVMDTISGHALKGAIREVVLPDSRIMTDELPSYKGIGRFYSGGHHTVKHSRRQYARGDVHINSAESYFALLKRGVHGIFHHVSKKHLGRYCHEFSFRWNNRTVNDGIRRLTAIKQSDLKRLTYAQLVEKDKEKRA